MEDGEREEYWSEAYKRMAARNIELGDIVASLTDELNDLRSGEYLARVIEERDRYRKALEFYADRGFDGYDVDLHSYGLGMETGAIIKDGGDIARAALESTNEPT